MRGFTTLSLGVTAVLVGALLAVGCSSGPKVGTTAPQFSAVDADGEAVSLAEFEGGVLILDFWAVW